MGNFSFFPVRLDSHTECAAAVPSIGYGASMFTSSGVNLCLNSHLNRTQTQDPFGMWTTAVPDLCDPAPLRAGNTRMSCELDVDNSTSNSHV